MPDSFRLECYAMLLYVEGGLSTCKAIDRYLAAKTLIPPNLAGYLVEPFDEKYGVEMSSK